jgi:hypothetical protein
VALSRLYSQLAGGLLADINSASHGNQLQLRKGKMESADVSPWRSKLKGCL